MVVRVNTIKRFWAQVAKIQYDGIEGECWEFTGHVNKNTGYAAHRWVYELYVGPIPKGLEPDHTCNNRRCVNYEQHLELVTRSENLRRAAARARAEGRPWRAMTAETRAKISATKTGVKVPKIGDAMRGRMLTEEHKTKIAAGLIQAHGAHPEIRERIAEKNRGTVHSLESRKAQSESMKRAWAAKEGEARKLPPRTMSEESREKIRASLTGQKFTEERRAALREAWAKRKREAANGHP